MVAATTTAWRRPLEEAGALGLREGAARGAAVSDFRRVGAGILDRSDRRRARPGTHGRRSHLARAGRAPTKEEALMANMVRGRVLTRRRVVR